MVEDITRKAIEVNLADLQSQGLLDGSLCSELERLTVESVRLSNWTDASHHLPAANYQRLRGSGPVSKVLRTLAYLLERLAQSASELSERGVQISRVRLEDTNSGCSHYAGRIVVEAQEKEGAEIVLFEGPFIWDCSAHGMPQSSAAHQLGYRCMVSFPEIMGRTAVTVS
jgi:hypothetical protein